MKKQTFGSMITTMRKENGMTQLELAEKMGVTDKAVSKWERDLSFPDVSSIPRLAEIFDISVDELLQVKAEANESPEKNKISEIIDIAFKSVALAMGVAVTVLSVLGKLGVNEAVSMLGTGLACIAITQFSRKD